MYSGKNPDELVRPTISAGEDVVVIPIRVSAQDEASAGVPQVTIRLHLILPVVGADGSGASDIVVERADNYRRGSRNQCVTQERSDRAWAIYGDETGSTGDIHALGRSEQAVVDEVIESCLVTGHGKPVSIYGRRYLYTGRPLHGNPQPLPRAMPVQMGPGSSGGTVAGEPLIRPSIHEPKKIHVRQ